MSFLYFFLIIFFVFAWIFYFFRKKIIEIFTSKKYLKSTILMFLSFFVAVFWVIYYNYEKEISLRWDSSDVVFILDVSQSMDVLDYQEKLDTFSRLQIAKDFIKEFIEKNPGNRYSLTIFAWDFTEVIPFTNDLDLYFTFLQNADSSSIIKWWNVLREAFSSSISRFVWEKTTWAIIVLSDFEFPWKDEKFIDSYLENLNAYKKQIEENKIKVFAVWLWQERWWVIPIWYDFLWNMNYKKDSFWANVISKFDKKSFEKFSKVVWSINFKIEEYSDIKNIIWKIKDIPSKALDMKKNINADFSRFIIIFSYILFLFYMIFYFFERKTKN